MGQAIGLTLIVGVAAMAAHAALKPNPGGKEEHHSIPWEAKKPLIDKYGTWAVNRAEAFCPENDTACVEREARRLIEVYRHRRAR